MATLHIQPQRGEPWTAELGGGVVSIGRGPDNDVSLADPNCSSRHAVIERGEQGFVLRDLESKNGTYVNGRRITCPVTLARGDEIKIGSTILFFDRAKGPRVTVVDAPTTSGDASAAVPYREILERTSGPGESTSRFAVPADMAEENRILQVLVGVGEALVAHKPVPDLLEDILDVIFAEFCIGK